MKTKAIVRSTAAHAAASFALALALLAGVGQVRADEIQLLSAAAMQTVLKVIVSDFERTSGHKLNIAYSTMGAITERILAGETPDLVIGSTPSMARLAKEGRIKADSQVTIAKVGVGIVVPTGTPLTRIDSIEDFKRALLAAKTVVYADPAGGGAAGIHVARVIEQLGMSEQLKPKTRFGSGGDVTEVTLAQGDGALGMTQLSEILGKPGAQFVGALPDELQNYTGVTAATPTGARQSAAVTEFLKFLQGASAAAAMHAKGMQPG